MADLLEIWNRALGHVGEGQTVADEQEDSAPAKALRRMWPMARDAVLAAHPWGFADRRVTATPYPRQPRWGRAYLYPSDALHIRHLGTVDDVMLGAASFMHADPPAWEVGGATSDTGIDTTLILTDAELATITYTRRVEESSRYPVYVADCMSWRLAFDIAVPLSVSTEIRANAFKVMQAVLTDAIYRDAQQSRQARQGEGELIRARW